MKKKVLLNIIKVTILLAFLVPIYASIARGSITNDSASMLLGDEAVLPISNEELLFSSIFESTQTTSNSETAALAIGPNQIRIRGEILYTNDQGGYSPARFIEVRIMDRDTGPDEEIWVGQTDADGYYDVVMDNNDGFKQKGRDPYVEFWAVGIGWEAQNGDGDTYLWRSEVLKHNCAGGEEFYVGGPLPTIISPVFMAGDACFAEAEWIYGLTGWSRDKVVIKWPYDPEKLGPHSTGEEIHLPLQPGNHATLYHEYAHCVMYALYGDRWPIGTVGGPHQLWTPQAPANAFTEGWADFMKCAPGNDPNWQPDIETNDWYNWNTTGNMDGVHIEGTVASILWDIFDGTGTEKGWDRFRSSYTWTDSLAEGFEPIFWLLHDYGVQISDMNDFWVKWTTRYPSLSTSMGPLCSIYWSYGVDYDAFAPFGGSIIIDHGNAYSERLVTLNASCKDWGSGVKFVRFSNDLGNTWGTWQSYGPEYSYYMANPSTGIQYVSAQFKDYNGHVSSVYTDSIILDETSPTGSVVIGYGNPGVTKTPFVTLYLTYYDAGSGAAQVRYSEDGTHFEPWEAPTSTKSWTLDYSLTNLKGSRNIYYQVMDNLGHVSEIYYDSITLDISPPTFTIWTDKTNYRIGDTMNVYTRLTNPDVGFSVRATIEYRLPNGNTGILYDEIHRLPAGYDSGTVLWRSDTLPTMRPGDYMWIASIRDPTSYALITRSEWTWTIF